MRRRTRSFSTNQHGVWRSIDTIHPQMSHLASERKYQRPDQQLHIPHGKGCRLRSDRHQFPASMSCRIDTESARRRWLIRCHPKHSASVTPWRAVENRQPARLAVCAMGCKAFAIQEDNVMRLWYRPFRQFLKIVVVHLRSRTSVLGWEAGFSGQLVKAAINSFAWITSSSRRKALEQEMSYAEDQKKINCLP